jgi:hypothetical protein
MDGDQDEIMDDEDNDLWDGFFSDLIDCILIGCILGLVAFLASGCASPAPVVLDKDKHYARNVQFEINKAKGQPTMVAARAPRYEIRLKSEIDMDYLLIRSCGREHGVEKAGDEFRYSMEPNLVELESHSCPISFVGAEKGANRRTLGWVDFQDPRYTYPARVDCDGSWANVVGVAACESGAGLEARLEFPEPTDLATTNPDCKLTLLKDADGVRVFKFKLPRGECTHMFQERKGGLRVLKLSTYGFDERLPLRSR